VENERARRRRNRRRVTSALSGALALAVALGSFGWAQRGVAEREAITARMQELAVEAEAAIDEDPELAVLLALEAYDLSEQLDLERTPGEVMRALQVTSQGSRLIGRLPHGFLNVAISGDGALVAVDDAESPSLVHVYHAVTLELLETFDTGVSVGWLDFDPTGELLAVGHSDPFGLLSEDALVGAPSVSLFAVDDFREVLEVSDLGVVWEAMWSDDGRYLAAVVDDGTVVLDRTGSEVSTFPNYGKWVPDSGRLALIDGEGVTIVDAVSGESEARIDTPGVEPSFIAPSSDGASVVTGSFASRQVQLWRAGLHEAVFSFLSPGLQSARLDPSGRYVISQGNDSVVVFTDVSSGRDQLVLAGHQGGSYDIAVTLDGSRAFVPTYSGTLVWDLTDAGPADLGNLDVEGDCHCDGRPSCPR
jgi:hypothetical protein